MPQVAHFDRMDYRTRLVNPQNEPGNTMIETRGLTRLFGAVRAVDGLDLRVQRGEIFGLVGPDGAGKTTTIRMLLGLMRPTHGTAEVLDVDITRHPERARPHPGYMSQRFTLYNDLTVIENLRFFGRAYGLRRKRLAERIDFALRMADLAGRENQRARSLAGGWRQRLAQPSCTSRRWRFWMNRLPALTRFRAAPSGSCCTGWPNPA